MQSGNFRKNFFSDLATIKFNTSFHCKCFSGVESHLNAFGKQNLNTMTEFCFKSCRRIPSVPKTFKIIEFFLALIKEFYQIVVASDELSH